MLDTMVEHVIGIDPDRDRVTASVVDTSTTGEQATAVFGTTRLGYDRLLKWADQHTQTADRVWSVEGSGSYGAGVTTYLAARGELVVEFNDPTPTRDGAKTDALDARRAARQVLGRPWPSVPRARGDREALRVLETTRKGAQTARVAAICELKALVVTAPIDLRDQLRSLNTAALVAKCSAFRIRPASVNELTATKQAMRSVARRIRALATEITELKTSIAELITAVAPQLLQQYGTRARADHRRAGIHRLVTPRPMPQRSRLRSPGRRRTPPSVFGATNPPPAQPLRRPPTQPRPPHHRYHPRSGLPQNPGLHSQTHQPRKNHPRSPTLPQTVHRPPPLPTPPKPAPNPGRTSPTVPHGNAATPPQAQNPIPRQNPDLENIEASWSSVRG